MDERLKKLVEDSDNIVFFGGAGVSTESGIPDFRSEKGLYHAKQTYGYPPETMLSHTFYVNHTEMFFKYYKENLIHTEAEPNAAHRALAKLEKAGKLKGIVTQNIDGLHQKAGSQKVYEVHGTIMTNHCEKCGKPYGLDYVVDEKNCRNGVPKCSCGGTVKPDVVLYEEMLPEDTVAKAVKAISEADLLIIGGTSLNVYPAAGFINYFHGRNIVLINMAETPFDSRADLVIHEPIGKVMNLDGQEDIFKEKAGR
ncbi:MAG: NAD-dependent protein deacylase [Eubacteriales bacterium]|nr:NAD-dependent protein deacylase [Eubacteriales bacterium]